MYTGLLTKMHTQLNEPVEYILNINNQAIDMNMLIGAKLKFTFLNEIICQGCGVKINKSFAQGYCYNCFATLPQTAECIIRPELCKAHEGIARDMKWSEENCLQDHYVYLAISSGLKVGVTRNTQIPTRWIDQGASKAIKLAKTPNRHLAGLIEVALKKHFSDKTSWQKMLKNEVIDADLISAKARAKALLTDNLRQYVIDNDDVTEIEYPVLEFPQKIKSLSFDKEVEASGTLMGIKGQYLLFDGGRVLNIRKHGGYKVKLQVG